MTRAIEDGSERFLWTAQRTFILMRERARLPKPTSFRVIAGLVGSTERSARAKARRLEAGTDAAPAMTASVERACLMCEAVFAAEGRLNRVCYDCKQTMAWRG
jgi:hypothetical protein